MTAIGILGATGRMGRAIADVAAELGIAVDPDAPDVLVDFTAPTALAANLDRALAAGLPIVIGTTGLTPDHHALIDHAAATIPVLQTANTSLGINLLRLLVEQAARRLGDDWDVEIVEMHHRNKRDAPSGTALLLGAGVATGRGPSALADRRFDRLAAGPHPREPGGVHYASLRGGSVAGDHLVIFAGEGERIELGHRAENRAIFARGAVRAALWLAGRAPGRYGMADVLAEG